MLSGRLTLTSGVQVLTSTVSGAGTIYFTPYLGNQIGIYNGSSFVNTAFSELSQTTTDTTKSPAAVANNSNYDLFVWLDSSTVRCTRGPAWSSDTARGTGAGTTELERVLGFMVNKVSITNGPAAQRGLYVGSVRSNGSALIDWIYGGIDTAAILGVWNMFNRVDVGTFMLSSVDSFTMTSNGVRAWNNSNTNRISFISGLREECFIARGYGLVSGSFPAGLGIGFNSTSAISGLNAIYKGGSIPGGGFSLHAASALGYNYFQALEVSEGGAATGYGDNGAAGFNQSGFSMTGRM
jgi:hypothetical protein